MTTAISSPAGAESPTTVLARYAAGIGFANLPPDVVHRVKLTVLDTLGVMLAGGLTDIGQRVVRSCAALAPGAAATVLAKGTSTASVAGAALANGTLSDLLESQDGWRFGGIHPSLVIASALAVCESTQASGQDLISAIVAGYEVGNRVAATAHPYHMAGGYMPNGTAGSVGAAAAAARAMRLDATPFANALGIAGFLLPVSTAENLWEGYSSKAFHTGYAARMGVEAAALAGAGFEACALEGSKSRGRGFMEIMNKQAPDLAPMQRGLGEWFTTRETYFKFFPACRLGHAAIEAAVALAVEGSFATADIASIEVHIFGHAAGLLNRYLEPGASLSAAQYSLPYQMAVSLIDKAYGMAQLQPQRRDDAAVLALARRTQVIADAAMTAEYPNSTPARVVVLTTDGQRHEKTVPIPAGDPRRNVTDVQIFDKFQRFSAPAVGDAGVQALRDEVMALEAARDVAPLLRRVRELVSA